jgi:peroxiredoxin
LVIAVCHLPLHQSADTDTAQIETDGSALLTIRAEKPSMCDVRVGESYFRLFVVPGDTTTVYTAIDKVSNRITPVQFEGSTRVMNEYYQAKAKSFGYQDTRMPLNAAVTSKSTYQQIGRQVDSVLAREAAFLEACPMALPGWFRNLEKANITYIGPVFKVDNGYYNQQFKIFRDSLPVGYYERLASLPPNDPAALYSDFYLWYVNRYLWISQPGLGAKAASLGKEARSKYLFSQYVPMAINKLEGSVRDVYLTQQLLSLIPADGSDWSYADSALIANRRYFADSGYYDYLNKVLAARSQANGSGYLKRGSAAPDFRLPDKKGQLRSLRDYKGEVVYVNFWATWCKPCLAAFPAEKQLQQQFKGQRVTFINICIGDKKEKWQQALDKYQLQGVNLFANPGETATLKKQYDVQSIPHYMLIDMEGKIRETSANGPAAAADQIKALLQ